MLLLDLQCCRVTIKLNNSRYFRLKSSLQEVALTRHWGTCSLNPTGEEYIVQNNNKCYGLDFFTV